MLSAEAIMDRWCCQMKQSWIPDGATVDRWCFLMEKGKHKKKGSNSMVMLRMEFDTWLPNGTHDSDTHIFF